MMKVPMKTILKIGGGLMLGVASVMSAYDADEKTQVMIKKIAEKSVSMLEKKES